MAIKVSAKEIFFVYSDRNITLLEVLYWKDMHSEVKLCFLKSTVVWTRKDQFKPRYWLSIERSITQRTNCLWAARYSLGHSKSTPVVPTVPAPSIHDHRYMMYSCHVIQTRFKPSPLNQFLNSPPIRFKPGSQKALLHLIQVQFFEWSCLFWWPNLVIQAGYTSTESLRGFYSYLWWGDQMHSYKTLNLCEKRHSNFSTVFNLSLKIHKD